MPLPLAAIGLGMAGLGAAGHLFGVGRMNADRSAFDYDPQNLSLAEYRKLSDPSYGLDRFHRLAESTALKRSDLLATAAMTGGYSGAAIAQADAGRGRARDQALSAFGDFRVGADRAALGALGMHQQKEQYVTEGMHAVRSYNAQRNASFVNNLLSGGLGIAGRAIPMGGAGPAARSAATGAPPLVSQVDPSSLQIPGYAPGLLPLPRLAPRDTSGLNGTVEVGPAQIGYGGYAPNYGMADYLGSYYG